MKKMVYVVTMYRWGDRECHSYVIGVYSTKTKAEKAGQKEKEYRGGTKYYPECIVVPMDAEYGPGFKTIIALEHNPYMTRHPTTSSTLQGDTDEDTDCL